jgi:hypothetical protein
MSDEKFVNTEFGWAIESHEPLRNDLYWIPTGTNHIYVFDGDGWVRIRPPEKRKLPDGDLDHG